MDGMLGVLSYGIGTILGIVQTANQSIALNMLYPYPTVGSRAASRKATAAASAVA